MSPEMGHWPGLVHPSGVSHHPVLCQYLGYHTEPCSHRLQSLQGDKAVMVPPPSRCLSAPLVVAVGHRCVYNDNVGMATAQARGRER